MARHGEQHAQARPEAGPGRIPPQQAPPEQPTDMPKRSWTGVLKRTAAEFKDDNLSDWAAALTYYAVLSIFPALLALVSLLGLFGSGAIQPLIDSLGRVAPANVRDILTGVLTSLQNNRGASGIAFIVGLAVALWSASGYVAAFMRAANAVYDMPEGRPWWMLLPLRVGITLVVVVLLAVSAVAVVFTGGLAQQAASLLGIGPTAVTVWNIAKWPVILLFVIFILALLYWAAPNVKPPGFRWITPGSAIAVVLWLAASAAFAFYVANFSSYNRTYGTLAGVIVFLVWLWISNIAVLLGVEFDAEMQRGRAIRAGQPPEAEPYARPRSTRKLDERERQRVRHPV
ncbi:YihY/virulence factor BrkB family protein [Streptomonospora nanhaiensis]|uniref:Membrane protein n=1 Tax=Streptomonospora nanhaiensis TaxID=1323731 RepID=A0A853BID0_9ACTN|nr:YihY/virulence factor BrkB family protein [Streptomonospora nanhaiensis]NYI95179.1 membrane protein [Streptomonospora nanhaiensis]